MERYKGERELLALEVDVIHGLVHGPGRGGDGLPRPGLPRAMDPSVRAVMAWSPGARVLALGAEVAAAMGEGGGRGDVDRHGGFEACGDSEACGEPDACGDVGACGDADACRESDDACGALRACRGFDVCRESGACGVLHACGGADACRASDTCGEPGGCGHFGGMEQPYVPGGPPEILVRIAATRTAAGDPVSVRGGPSFTFPDHLAGAWSAPLPLLLSDTEGRAAARELTRPDNWQPGEWAELVSGAAGEWAMAVHDGSPVSICHTPAANARAAEADIWTRADFRGRGLAPATVAAWSLRARPDGRVLFYSTTADNHASRSVARSLGLTPLGWIWTVR
ncbi:GNAT family N-acetyltransferase [Streptomyces sp. NPDC093510]|uniref:GNAT family N-acetyltransferase n=1 Tax=Streptomyces sp. NPDC093510 TaxID=3155199 RepID=UPI00341DB1D2